MRSGELIPEPEQTTLGLSTLIQYCVCEYAEGGTRLEAAGQAGRGTWLLMISQVHMPFDVIYI